MERAALVNALMDAADVAQACCGAVIDGADFTVWDVPTPKSDLIRTYRRRAKHVDRIGLEHGGFQEALADLDAWETGTVRLGQVKDRTENRHYQLFISAEADQLVACLWVRHPR